MKKILFVGPYPPPFGGIASHLNDLLPALVREGYETISISTSLKNEIRTEENLKNIYFNPKLYLKKNFLRFSKSFLVNYNIKKDLDIKEYARIVNLAEAISETVYKEKVDSIFIYTIDLGLVIPILRRRFGNTLSVFLMIFGGFYLDPDKYLVKRMFLQSVFSKTDKILSSSRYCGDSIRKVLKLDYPVDVIYVGVDTDMYHPDNDGMKLRKELGIPEKSTVFLFLGRMHKSMGFDFILQTAQKLIDLDENLYLIIAGAISDLSKDAEKLSESNSRIKFCPDIPFDRKPEYYAACDVFLAPTMDRHACMGVSIKEAMSSGKPVIASTSGGIPEAVEDGVNGYLVPFSSGELNSDKFYSSAIALSSNPNLRMEMGEKGYDKVQKLFSNEQTSANYLNMVVTTKRFIKL